MYIVSNNQTYTISAIDPNSGISFSVVSVNMTLDTAIFGVSISNGFNLSYALKNLKVLFDNTSYTFNQSCFSSKNAE